MTDKCPYNNDRCICQRCDLNVVCHRDCDECRWAGEAVHDVRMCSAYRGEGTKDNVP